jgi:hypothetical protein
MLQKFFETRFFCEIPASLPLNELELLRVPWG